MIMIIKRFSRAGRSRLTDMTILGTPVCLLNQYDFTFPHFVEGFIVQGVIWLCFDWSYEAKLDR